MIVDKEKGVWRWTSFFLPANLNSGLDESSDKFSFQNTSYLNSRGQASADLSEDWCQRYGFALKLV